MSPRLNTGMYDRVFALDTQMVFEARPLDQLEWATLSAGPILLLILPQVSAEVDARKRDGRLARRARDFNRLLEPSIEHGKPEPIVESPIRVDIAYVPSTTIDWGSLDDLESDNNDDRIVAQALNALVDKADRIELLSFDSRPRAAARRHGMNAIKPEESWLLEPELSPSARRIAELEQRVGLLQASQPELEVEIRFLTDPPLVRYHVAPLPSEVAAASAKRIVLWNPRQGQRTMGYDIFLNPNYDEEYEDYVEAITRADVPHFHAGLARFFSQYPVEVRITNVGAMHAENVAVELRSGNALVHSSPFLVNVFGRQPPSTDRNIPSGPGIVDRLRPDRSYFYLADSGDPSSPVQYSCTDFRHGRTQLLAPAVELTEQTIDQVHFEVRITASNMRGEVRGRSIVPTSVVIAEIGNLVDLDNLAVRQFPAVAAQLAPLLADDADEVIRFNNDGTLAT